MRKIRLSRVLILCLPLVCMIVMLVFISRPKLVEESTYKPSLEQFLKVSIKPVGQTMYVWGGGWNKQDTGAGIEAKTIGVSKRWKEFFERQDAFYDYETTKYQIHDGLDCSGYVGWVVYNTMNTESGLDGYVDLASKQTTNFEKLGWGSITPASQIVSYMPGDIMSSEGHIYIVLGQMEDGSVLLVHSSPPGVRICGTDNFGTGRSQAIELATKVMNEHFKEWVSKYPDCVVDISYLEDYDQFRWNESTFSDIESIQKHTCDEILSLLL